MGGRVVISGCSGGGKSTLLRELARRGHRVVEEPGRRIIEEELARGGRALPWIDLAAFARRALAVSLADLDHTPDEGWTFFDRGAVDAACALQHAAGETALRSLAAHIRYDRRVFLTPPWAEIYVADAARRHGFDEAVAEYEPLVSAFVQLGYEATILPRTTVEDRADLVLTALGLIAGHRV